MCVQVHMCAAAWCMHVCGSQGSTLGIIPHIPLIDECSPWPGAHHFHSPGALARWMLTLKHWEYRHRPWPASWGWNPGPHVHVLSTFLTKQSPQTHRAPFFSETSWAALPWKRRQEKSQRRNPVWIIGSGVSRGKSGPNPLLPLIWCWTQNWVWLCNQAKAHFIWARFQLHLKLSH